MYVTILSQTPTLAISVLACPYLHTAALTHTHTQIVHVYMHAYSGTQKRTQNQNAHTIQAICCLIWLREQEEFKQTNYILRDSLLYKSIHTTEFKKAALSLAVRKLTSHSHCNRMPVE